MRKLIILSLILTISFQGLCANQLINKHVHTRGEWLELNLYWELYKTKSIWDARFPVNIKMINNNTVGINVQYIEKDIDKGFKSFEEFQVKVEKKTRKIFDRILSKHEWAQKMRLFYSFTEL